MSADEKGITWVITGGAACGKSHVTRFLAGLFNMSAVVFCADDSVHEIMRRPEVLKEIAAAFEVPDAVAEEAALLRAWLRQHVLGSPSGRRRLEGILHPLVLSALDEARERAWAGGRNLFLAEVPLHYEIGSTVSADFVIVVASSRSVQVRRMMETRGLDEPTVQTFLDAQWPIEAKVERADAVVWNDGSLPSLEDQVLALAGPLLKA